MRRHSGFGWLELILGIVLILLGVLTFISPARMLGGVVVLYGIAAVVMGIADIVLYIQVERYTGFGPILALISGILSVMSGLMLVVYPRAGQLVMAMLFPIWFIAHCISRLMHLGTIRFASGDGMYYFTLIVNIIGLILGFLMILDPFVSLISIGYIVSLYLILLGIDSIVMAVSRMGR